MIGTNEALWLAVNALQSQRRSADAIPYLDRLIALRDPQDPLLFEMLYQRARMALHVGQYADAIPYLDHALELRPGDMIGLMLRAFCQLQLGDVGTEISRDFMLVIARTEAIDAASVV